MFNSTITSPSEQNLRKEFIAFDVVAYTTSFTGLNVSHCISDFLLNVCCSLWYKHCLPFRELAIFSYRSIDRISN